MYEGSVNVPTDKAAWAWGVLDKNPQSNSQLDYTE